VQVVFSLQVSPLSYCGRVSSQFFLHAT